MLTFDALCEMVQPVRIQGAGRRPVTGATSFDDAGPDDLAFAEDVKFLSRLDSTRAGVLLVPYLIWLSFAVLLNIFIAAMNYQ